MRLGPPADTHTGLGGNNNYLQAVDLDVNNRCLALYEGTQFTVTGCIAQSFREFLYLRPTGNGNIQAATIRDLYLEATLPQSKVLVFDGHHASKDNCKTTHHVTLEHVSIYEPDVQLLDFGYYAGTPAEGEVAMYSLFLLDIYRTGGGDIIIPSFVKPVFVRGCKGARIYVESSHATVLATEAHEGWSVDGHCTRHIDTMPVVQAPSLPSSQEVEARNHSGLVTISNTERSATIAFTLDEVNTEYDLVCSVAYSSGRPRPRAYIFTGIRDKERGQCTITVLGSPGPGSSVTYRWVLVR